MAFIIQIMGVPLEGVSVPEENEYIESFDPLPNKDGFGIGKLKTTPDKSRAKRFVSHVEAWEFWKQQSPTVPIRPDGKPNRPLTAYTVVIDPVEE